MKLLTKLKVFAATGILLIAAGFAYGIFDKNMTSPFSNRFDDVEVGLHVVYSPPDARPVLAVQLSMTLPVIQSVESSPWDATIKVPHATRVILSVVQGRRNETACTILSKSGTILDHQELYGPGTISCQHLVT
jgi:hypothetical protein